jgi:phage FluMu protein Com
MITEITVYNVKCDRCGKLAETEYSGWDNKDYAEDIALQSEYIFLHKNNQVKHYCPDCYFLNEDDEYEPLPDIPNPKPLNIKP